MALPSARPHEPDKVDSCATNDGGKRRCGEIVEFMENEGAGISDMGPALPTIPLVMTLIGRSLTILLLGFPWPMGPAMWI